MAARKDPGPGEWAMFIYRLKPGAGPEYDRWHAQVWPELLAKIDEAGVYDYQIWRHEEIVVSRLRTRRGFREAQAIQMGSEIQKKWTATLGHLFESYQTKDGEPLWLDEVFRLGVEDEELKG